MTESTALDVANLPALPGGWSYAALEDLLEPNGISYGIVQPGNHDLAGIPIVRVKDLKAGRIIRENPLRVSSEIEEKYSRTRLKGGEVLVSLVGSVGETAVASGDLSGWNVARAIGVLRVSGEVSPSWLKICLAGDVAQHYMHSHLNTTVQATLNLRDLRKVPIVLPSERDRRAITDVAAALDSKIAVNERIAATALDLADARYACSVRELDLGPETFGSTATVVGGGTPSTKMEGYWGGEIAWTTPTDVTALSAPYLFETGRTITDQGLDNCASQLYPAQSIFMTSRATIGAFALPQMPAAVNQGFIVVLPQTEELKWWLLHEMRSRVDEMIGLANGSTFLELSRKNFKAMPIRLAGDRSITEFAQAVSPLHARAAQATAESRTLATLRDTLLPQLMSGKLRVREAEKIVEAAV
ncbi:restriction endonuclease subunit S [Streptomyces sp. NPDC048288]|uniref:restriction endonuclease subunit S n=1 Tax=Streptomyces sp. NPDC048288 TaxID=3365529 RepID=UPI003718B991